MSFVIIIISPLFLHIALAVLIHIIHLRGRHIYRLRNISILAVLNNAVVWMVSTRLPTSKSSGPFSNPLVTVPNAPITIGIIVTCMFHGFFTSLARSRYLSFFLHSFSFILWSAGTAKSTILQVLFIIIIIIIIYSSRVFHIIIIKTVFHEHTVPQNNANVLTLWQKYYFFILFLLIVFGFFILS